MGDFGARLRTIRMREGIGVRELARRIGVSASLISMIETGKAKPSVDTLYEILQEFDVSLEEMFDGQGPVRAAPEATLTVKDGPVQRAPNRSRIQLERGVRWEQLTVHSTPGAEFLYVVYEPGFVPLPDSTFQRHNGHEWGYVISGNLGVTIGFEQYVLDAGDSVSFASDTPHRLFCIGDKPAHAIWFTLGRDGFAGHSSTE